MIFVVTGALSLVPEYDSFADVNSMETAGWSISTLLLNEPGHWRSPRAGGLDWQTQVDTPQRIDMIGLAAEEGGLRREKIRALARIADANYTYLKTELLKIRQDFNIVFHEYAVVETGDTFQKVENGRTSSPPPAIADQFEPPSAPTPYDDADQQVHYGSIKLNGATRYFLVTSHEQRHDQVYHSDSWDFSDATNVSFDDDAVISFNGRRYELDAGDAGISMSDGQVLVMHRVIARLGRRPPAAQDAVTQLTRYSNIGETLVKMEMELWS